MLFWRAMVWVWIGVALVATIIEVLVPVFGFILVAASALAAAAAAALGQPGWLQSCVFAGSCLFTLTLLRSRIIHKLAAAAPGVPSRTEKLVGHRGRVIEAIEPAGGHGRVLV